MVVQQLVMILVFSWEEVSSSPPNPPRCLQLWEHISKNSTYPKRIHEMFRKWGTKQQTQYGGRLKYNHVIIYIKFRWGKLFI